MSSCRSTASLIAAGIVGTAAVTKSSSSSHCTDSTRLLAASSSHDVFEGSMLSAVIHSSIRVSAATEILTGCGTASSSSTFTSSMCLLSDAA